MEGVAFVVLQTAQVYQHDQPKIKDHQLLDYIHDLCTLLIDLT
jgi:hypothetical protein